MTLQPPVLDDITWQQMMDAILRRVPAESDGIWTLHAPVDPGVTVLELFAYLLEQRLYELDQVTDELVLAVLRLLGLPAPAAAVPAATVLRLAAAQDGVPAAVVPAGAAFARDPLQQVAFTVDAPATVLPVVDDQVQVFAGGVDRSADLRAGRPVPLLSRLGPDGGVAAEVRLVLPLDPAVRPAAGAAVSLLFGLTSPVPASWLPSAVPDVPAPAALTWTWFRPDGTDVSTVESVEDGTAGLRRSGVVRVPLPEAWCEGGTEDVPAAYGLRISTAAATYSTPPTLVQLAANVAVARHRRVLTVTDADLADQLRAWLRLPRQRLDLPGARGLLLDADVRLVRDGVGRDWAAVPDFTFTGPADRVFTVDRTDGAVRFGDGRNGAIPVLDDAGGEPVVAVTYAIGGGIAGNGGQTGNWLPIRDGSPSDVDPGLVVSAANVVPALGGQEAESIAAVRTRIGDSLAEVTRAVTAADFAELAVTTPGVAIARAYVGIGEHPGYPCASVPGAVTVRIVPGVPEPEAALADPGYTPVLLPDPGAVRAVRARLADARLIGTEVFVRPPAYRQVALLVEVSGGPADPAAVRAAIRTALRRFLDPLRGGPDGEGWPFGDPLRPSGLLRAAQLALGDRAAVERVAIGLDGAAPAGGCDDVALGPGRLPALGLVRVRTVAGQPGEGPS